MPLAPRRTGSLVAGILALGLATPGYPQLGFGDAGELVPTRLAPDAAQGVLAPAALVEALFSFHVVEPGATPEREALEQMRGGVTRFVELAGELLGPGEVELRFRDLASRNPLERGRIPLYWIASVHPHNVNVGTPYTGLAIAPKGPPGAKADAAGVTVHELAHLFFGKFNDGLAEPIANMFQARLFQDGPVLLGSRALLRRIAEGLHRGTFDLESLMAYRPNTTRHLCAAHAALGSAEATEAFASASTQAALAGLIEEFPGAWPEGLAEHLRGARGPEGAPARVEYPNPNETRGPVREAFASLGDTLQFFLVETLGIQAYLRFYYAPTASTLGELGVSGGFAGLEGAMIAWLDGKARGMEGRLKGASSAEIQGRVLDRFLRGSLPPGQEEGDPLACLDPARWRTAACDSSRPYPEAATAPGPGAGADRGPGRTADGGGPSRPLGPGEGPGARGPGGPGGSGGPGGPGAPDGPGAPGGPGGPPPPRPWPEQLAAMRVPRREGEALPIAFRVTEQLGTGFDIERFCAPERASSAEPPVPADPP